MTLKDKNMPAKKAKTTKKCIYCGKDFYPYLNNINRHVFCSKNCRLAYYKERHEFLNPYKPTKKPTKKPTRKPTKKPTRKPTKKPIKKLIKKATKRFSISFCLIIKK